VLIDVKHHERVALALSFTWFFCVLAAYYMVRPVRDQLSGAVGSESLPVFYLATFVATLVMTPLFGALVARFPRKRFVPIVYLFFIACLFGFVPLFFAQHRIGAKTLGAVFFVWVSVFNLFVVSVFWSFMADIWSNMQARRLFPTIAIGGTAGAVLGPLLTSGLVATIGVAYLLIVSAGLLLVALACVFALNAWARAHPVAGQTHRDDEAIGGSMLAGIRQVLTTPFLRDMALLMLLADCIGTVAYALVADHALAHYPDRVARTAFYAHIDLATNGLVALCQLSVTRWLLVRHGATPALVWPAVLNVVVLLAFGVVGEAVIVAVLVVTRAGAYGFMQPARDSLYTRIGAEARYKGKNFIDTAVWRFGDVAVTSTLNGLRGVGMGLPGLALLTAAAAAAAGWFGYRASRSPELAPEAILAARPTNRRWNA
jgi:AAA family ATP:ADP antiporter